MATSTIVRAPCAVLLAIALFFSSQVISRASEDPVPVDSSAEVVDEVVTETQDSCCPEGYECTPVEPGDADEVAEEKEAPVCHGILTCTFWVGGHIIALPFRALNAVFRVVI